MALLSFSVRDIPDYGLPAGLVGGVAGGGVVFDAEAPEGWPVELPFLRSG